MPSLGINGGLMGPRRVSTTSNASGSWLLDEQCDAQRAGIWPIAGDNPIPALSPVLWYDFADGSTVTTSNGRITQITDKGSRGWTLTKSATGPQYVTGINGRKCVDWGSSPHQNYLRNSSTATETIAEIYIVLHAAFGSTFPNYNGLVTGFDGGGWNLTAHGGTTNFYNDGASFNAAYLNGSTSNSYASNVLPTINSPALLRVCRTNGTSLSSTGFQIGNDRSNTNLNRGWYGLIAEVVCFSTVLGSTDQTNVQTYLATKWGITLEGQGNG